MPVQHLWQQLYDQGDVYLDSYEGLYCVACEQFYSPDELVDGKCPIHGTPVDTVREENYFFRISKYTDRLLEHYRDHPEFVRPETRRHEVVSFVEQGLQDLSISRSSFTWGADPLGPQARLVRLGRRPPELPDRGRLGRRHGEVPAGVAGRLPLRRQGHPPLPRRHLAGDPARGRPAAAPHHPGPRLAAGRGREDEQDQAHRHRPHDLVEPFGSDAVRYFFQREVAFGQDGNFSWEAMVERYNADLRQRPRQLASRVTAMVERYRDGCCPPGPATDAEVAVQDAAERAYAEASAALDEVAYERPWPPSGGSWAPPTPTCRSASPGTWPRPATTSPWTRPCTPGPRRCGSPPCSPPLADQGRAGAVVGAGRRRGAGPRPGCRRRWPGAGCRGGRG